MEHTSGFCGASTSECKSRKNKQLVRVCLDGWAANELNLGIYECPLTLCNLYKNVPEKTNYDVFISALPPRISFPTKKFQQTMRHAELSLQSSLNHPSILDPGSYTRNGIDLVVSYRPPVASRSQRRAPPCCRETQAAVRSLGLSFRVSGGPGRPHGTLT